MLFDNIIGYQEEHNMISKALKVFIIFTIILSNNIFSESIIEKAKNKRLENLQYLLNLDVPLRNFGTKEFGHEELTRQRDIIKIKYASALSFYFEQNYLEAYRGFLEVQKDVEKLYEELSILYIDRTAEILKKAGEKVVDIEMVYSRGTGIVNDFIQDIQPSREQELLTPEQIQKKKDKNKLYHFTYDKRDIMKNLQLGYEYLGEAKRVRQEALNLEKWIEAKKEIDPGMRQKRIESYMAVINLCRRGKLNGLRVFKLVNRNNIYDIQGNKYKSKDDYKANFYVVENDLDPVFDPRIPEDYIVDANDSLNRVHSIELKKVEDGDLTKK